MNFIKRITIYIIIVLLCVSLYHDMVKENNYQTNNLHVNQTTHTQSFTTFDVVKVQVQPSDTILSVTEQINQSVHLHVNEIIDDFKLLNPFADPHDLQTDGFYYFADYQ